VATDWKLAMRIHLQGFDNGTGVPACVPGNRKPGTDVLVIRRAATCQAGIAGCPAEVGGQPYIQSSKCATETPTAPLIFDKSGITPYTLHARDCATVTGIRRYYVNIFYIATDNGAGSAIPTLTELQFDGAAFTVVPLVEGIEEFNVEYGIDNNKDGAPDTYTADPTNYTYAGCPTLPDTLPCTSPANNWSKVVTARVYLVSRNLDPTPNYVDPKSYSIGMDAGGLPIIKTYTDGYKRHAYTGVVRVVNAAERVDVP
jgi:type IV pilus assembly protein PilW